MLSSGLLRRPLSCAQALILRKHASGHPGALKKKNKASDKALEHFDDFYKQVFGKKWESIRGGLLGKQKYVAVVNNFADNEKTCTELELSGAINVRRLFQLEKQYIQEDYSKMKRWRLLNQAWKTAEDAPPEESEGQQESEDTGKAHDFSLKASLDSAEIDARRLVDSKDALAAEILHEFVPATKLKGKEDFIPESTHYKYYDPNSKFTVEIRKEFDFHFPDHLNVYCFDEGNDSDFRPAKNGQTGVLNYYLMNGGSVLPVLALGIEPGHRVLDLCAAPGGKSLLALQTMYPACVVANDVSMSRTNRIWHVYKQFLYDLKECWVDTGRVKLTSVDGRIYESDEEFDRILVDVPCTTDRQVLHDDDNNIFKPGRTKERLQLPELQCELLFNALKLVKKGGYVVYSTCSLSPIQNDGVVHMALKKVWEETQMTAVVVDLSPALLQTRKVFKYATKNTMKYGNLVLPNIYQNYGPTYVCKLQRIK